MAGSGVRLNIADSARLKRYLGKLDPKSRASISAQVLEAIARETSFDARTRHILRGRGDAKPVKKRLTWRSGDLSRSIEVDISQLPARSIVGSRLRYAPVHEQGGTFSIKAHRRKNRPGKRGGFGGGRSHKVKAHTAKFPRRPYLAPANKFVMEKRARLFFERALIRARSEA